MATIPAKRDICFGKALGLVVALFLSITIFAPGCGKARPARKVSLYQLTPDGKEDPALARAPLRVAIAGVISPKATIQSYEGLQVYLSEKLDRPVELVQRPTYADVNDLLRSGQAEVGLVCTYAYVKGNREFGLELLAAPEVEGKATYRSLVIVPRESSYRRLEDLRGKVFAFTDPMSFSGHVAPLYMLDRLGKRAHSFFGRYIFTYSHDNSIKAVADGLVDGAAVDSLVYDYLRERNPQVTDRVRVLASSDAVGTPPVVVPRGLDPELKARLKEVILGMHEDPLGRQALRQIMVDRFVPVNDRAYEPVRVMARKVGFEP